MRKLMKKSIIFLSAFIFMFGWVIRSNVHASTPVELYDNVWRLINSKYVTDMTMLLKQMQMLMWL